MRARLIANCVDRWPVPTGPGRFVVWGVAVLLTVFGVLGIGRLSVGGFSGMFDPNDPGEQRYEAYKAKFDQNHEAIVLIDTGEHGAAEEEAVAAATALGQSLEEESKIANVHWGLNPTDISPKLIRTLPPEEFAAQTERIVELRPLLASPTVAAMLQAGMAEAMRQSMQASQVPEAADTQAALREGATVFVALMDALNQRLETPPDHPVDLWSALQNAAGVPTWELLHSANGRLLVLRVELLEGVDDMPGYDGSLAVVRRHVEAIRLRFEGLEIGITGYEPTRSEAQDGIRSAAMRGVGGAFIALLVLTGLAWRSVWLPVVTLVLPALAVLWTLGMVGWWWGPVNALAFYGVGAAGLLALFAGLMLAGLWARGRTQVEAVRAVGAVLLRAGLFVIGVGICLILLGPTWWLDWTGGSEDPVLVGVRSAGGVIVIGVVMAWLAVMGLGPTLLSPQRAERAWTGSRGEMAGALSAAAGRRPMIAWGVGVVMLASVAMLATRTPSTFNLSGFLPSEAEGAVWQERALRWGGEGGMPLVSVARSIPEAQERTQRFRGLSEVGQLAGIARILPAKHSSVQDRLAQLEQTLGPVARAAAEIEHPTSVGAEADRHGNVLSLTDQVRLIRTGLGFLPPSTHDVLDELYPAMLVATDDFLRAAEALPPDERLEQLRALQIDYETTRRRAGRLVTGLLAPSPISAEDLATGGGLFDAWMALPEEVSGTRGNAAYQVKVFPTPPSTGWPGTREIKHFLQQTRTVDPAITGSLERLVLRSSAFTHAVHASVIVSLIAMGGIGLLLGLGWRGVLGTFIIITGTAFAIPACMAMLSQPVTALSWSVWPLAGMVGALWVAACVAHREDRYTPPQTPAASEAFGLMLALGFVVAAGLRSASAPGLTATAVAACLAAGLAGVLGLVLLPGRGSDDEPG